MESNNKFVMLVVGAVVSIVLITTLLVPVIADSGSGSQETIVNESNLGDYYIRADANTDLTLYMTVKDFGDEYGLTAWYSYEDLEVNPDADRWRINNGNYYGGLIGKYFYDGNTSIYDYLTGEEFTNLVWPIVISGTTATVTNSSDETATFTDVCFITAPQSIGTYVAIKNDDYDPAVIPYVGDSFVGLAFEDWSLDPEAVVIGFGDSDSGLDFTNFVDYDTPTGIVETGTIDVEDGYLTSITISYDGVDKEYSITDSTDDYELYYFVPAKVTIGGSGSTMSSAVSTVLSIVPLLMIIGVVMFVVGFALYRR